MDPKEILENNVLIAEFMSIPERDTNDPELWRILPSPFYGGAGACWNVHSKPKLIPQLKYDSSWDWLMPVVEKIDQIGASVIIGRFFCEIEYTNPLNEEQHFKVRIASGVKINAINGAVIDFIKWYNSSIQQ